MTLLGFNLGIEITQLLVVALVMPSLMVISRTALYPALRTAVASLGAVPASAWFAERTGMLASNPLEPVGEVIVEHPLTIAAVLAVLALVCAVAGVLRAVGSRGRRFASSVVSSLVDCV